MDLNYMFRQPLWPVRRQASYPVGTFRAEDIPVLDVHELAAGKLIALLDRHASRDLFDAHALLTKASLDVARLRIAFVVYGAMSRGLDLRTVSPERLVFETDELDRMLLPLLRGGRTDRAWASKLLGECRESLSILLPLQEGERAFLDALLERGQVEPDHLTVDSDLAERIRAHPLLQWKALNVRKVRGVDSDEERQEPE